MPIGPSHSSRGGGGRSFGGGGSRSFGGGGSRRSSSSSSSGSNLAGAIIGGLIYSAFADRRRRRFHSRYGYDPTPDEINSMPKRTAPTIFLILAIVVAFFSMFTMSMRSAAIRSAESHEITLNIMEEDYFDDYKPMIEAAKANPTPSSTSDSINCGNNYYKTKATFSTVKYSFYGDNPTTPALYQDFTEDNITYYFIVYKYFDIVAGKYATGTTYTQFSANQAQSLNGQIEIVYFNDGSESYSINTSYDLDECEEYDYREEQAEDNREMAGIFMIAFIVEIVIIAGMIALYVLKLKKYKRLVKQDEDLLYQKRQAETQKAQSEAQEAQYNAERKNRFCQYCGSQIDSDSNVCSGCGARFSDD